VKPLVRAAALTVVCFAFPPRTARAGDYLITPFAGKTFAASHTLMTTAQLPVIASVDEQRWTIGASAAWLSSNIIGAEVDFGYVPRFFKSNRNLASGNVTTMTGNVLLTVPLSVTRESLRPYLTAGMGVLRAGVADQADVATLDRNLLAVSIGGGAVGFLTPRAGVRFDLRRIRSTSNGVSLLTGESEPRLGFWRATIGVALRY
jgi:hypothetical protein